ncbi:MAG: asparagine synthase (glutamine-hydrolyzing), partial [Rhodospirillales bacterium]|nr:asparagine synthase (glutamine-hydrolyzing) [Rhodospirillales bacterium]
RLGKKPLHVALIDGALVFASELKAFHAVPGFRPSIDPRAIAMVMRQGWVPDSLCVWREVVKLPPGAMLSIRAEELDGMDIAGLAGRVRRWWSLADIAGPGQSAPLAADPCRLEDELHDLLRVAVGERMLADVPLGAFLSGGIDSATVVALMQAQSTRPVRTFTIGFAEAGFDEAGPAEAVAAHLGTEHTTFRVTAKDALDVVPLLPAIWDEPFADESQIPTYLVARLARQHVTVALSGDGGDESFGGYARHAAAARLEAALRLPLWLRRAGAATLLGLGPDRLDGLLARIQDHAGAGRVETPGRLRKMAGALAAADEARLYQQLLSLAPDPLARDRSDIGSSGCDTNRMAALPDLASRLMYRDTVGYLPGDILVKLDRASMAVSLEARCPLLDHRLIAFAWQLPMAVKLRDGKGKWLLRRVLRRYVPDALFERPKHGFNLPIGSWLAGPLRDWAEDLLAPQRLREQGLLDPERVQLSWRRHLRGRGDHAHALWAALMVSAWVSNRPALPAAAHRAPAHPTPAHLAAAHVSARPAAFAPAGADAPGVGRA